MAPQITLTPFDLHSCEAGVIGRLDVGAVENVPRNVLIVLGPGAFVLGELVKMSV